MKNLLTVLIFFLSLSMYGQNKEAYVLYGTHFLPTNTDDFDRHFGYDGDQFAGQWPINYRKAGRLNVPHRKRDYLLSKGSITAGYTVRKGRHNIGGLFMYEKQHMTHKTILVDYGQTITVNGNGEVTSVEGDGEITVIDLLPWSDSKMKNYHLAGRYDFNWISRQKLKLYSGLSLGLSMRTSNTLYHDVRSVQDDYPDELIESFYRNKNTDFQYHMHVNCLGIRYGHVWAIQAELGLGHRGYVNVGVNHLLFASEKWEKKRMEKEQLKMDKGK